MSYSSRREQSFRVYPIYIFGIYFDFLKFFLLLGLEELIISSLRSFEYCEVSLKIFSFYLSKPFFYWFFIANLLGKFWSLSSGIWCFWSLWVIAVSPNNSSESVYFSYSSKRKISSLEELSDRWWEFYRTIGENYCFYTPREL